MASDKNADNALLQFGLEDDLEVFMEAQRRAKKRRVTQVLGALKEIICEGKHE